MNIIYNDKEDDKIVGIEILDASKRVSLEKLMPVNYETSKTAK